MTHPLKPLDSVAPASLDSLPLVVDMDGTLIATDVLAEGIVAGVFARPFSTFFALTKLLGGRAPFKRRIAEIDAADIVTLPLRQDVLAWLRAEKSSGREIHLVSAADEGLVARVAQRVGVFDSAQGSRGRINLRSRRKAEALQQRFPDGFVYAGDSWADMAVWKRARGIVTVGVRGGLERAVKRVAVPIERSFLVQRAGLGAWINALRPQLWAINGLVFVPVLIWKEGQSWQAFWNGGLAFLMVSAMASGTYVVRDLAHVGSDRRLGLLQSRPMAGGSIPLHVGANVALVAVLGALAMAWLALPQLVIPLSIYLAIAACSFWPIGRGAIKDALLLAILLTLRLALGGMATGLPVPKWILGVSMGGVFVAGLTARKRGLR